MRFLSTITELSLCFVFFYVWDLNKNCIIQICFIVPHFFFLIEFILDLIFFSLLLNHVWLFDFLFNTPFTATEWNNNSK